MFGDIASEETNTKQEDATTIFLEESCRSPKPCLDELSKSNHADVMAVSSATVGAEADPLNNMEFVEVKQEKLDDLIAVKPEPLHYNEDLLLETALVTGGGCEDDPSWRGPASDGNLATCPPVSSEEGSSSVEEDTALSDLDVEAMQVIDKMRVGGTPSVFRYNCALCQYASNGEETYKMHLITHDNRRKTFACTECEFRSCYKASLRRHVLTHGNKRAKNFCCSHCPYKTDRTDSLRIHQLVHLPSRDKRYSCAHCHFESNREATYKLHLITHENRPKTFACTQCEFRSGYRASLQRHVLTHHKRDKNFCCSQCPYKTDRPDSLQRHQLLIHLPNTDKRYSCAHCHFRTAIKGTLSLHVKIHDTNRENNRPKPFACPNCDFRTGLRSRLRTHLLVHEKGNKRLACPLCPFTTNYVGVYKKHHYKKHLLSHDS